MKISQLPLETIKMMRVNDLVYELSRFMKETKVKGEEKKQLLADLENIRKVILEK